jgi:cell wall-associated NlpC family hydrolase
MGTELKSTVAALLFGLSMCVSTAQDGPSQNGPSVPSQPIHARKPDHALSSDDRLSVIAAALDSKQRVYSQRDCSHLVHAVYERAGFPYTYASSSDLYAGVARFQRVAEPQAGDLVVWRGHVGIVIRPSRHVFFSVMHGGPGIDDYEATYWKDRGRPRFYRYLKDDRRAGPSTCIKRPRQ